MKILYIAEIVGKAGVLALKKGLPVFKASHQVDFCIACGDGTTGGSGLGRNHAGYLRKLGADCITLGDFCFLKKDLTADLSHVPYVLRPVNMNAEAPGFGSHVFKLDDGRKVAVAALLGQAHFARMHGENPYALLPVLLERLHRETPFVVLDFHAEASAEKRTLLFEAAGKCTALIGSHTRVQTADEEVRDGTAYITDAGRTGVVNAVGGYAAEQAIAEYRTGIPEWTREAEGAAELQGMYIDADNRGCAVSVERVKLPVS